MKENEEEAYEYWKRVDALRGDISLSELADKMQIKGQSLRNMRSCNRRPKLDATKKLADYLHTSVDYLMTGTHSSVSDSITPEARYVEDHPEAQALVRAIMRDPALLQALSLVIESTERTIDTVKEAK